MHSANGLHQLLSVVWPLCWQAGCNRLCMAARPWVDHALTDGAGGPALHMYIHPGARLQQQSAAQSAGLFSPLHLLRLA
jgi:hypothetical protein